MSTRKLNLALSILSLLFGGIIYLFLRESTIIASVFGRIGLIEMIQKYFADVRCGFLSFYFVDFLWAFSLSTGLIAIWLPRRRGLYLCAIIAFCFGCVWELAQSLEIASGTGDWCDIAMYFAAALTSIVINIIKERNV